MKRILFALAAAAAIAGPVDQAAAQRSERQLGDIEVTSLAVETNDEDAAFEVIDRRMDETQTAGVMFGVLGAVASSAYTAGQDDQRAEPLEATAAAIDLDGIITQAMLERLQSRNAALAPDADQASHTLLVEIGEWGLVRRAQLPDLDMRAYLKLNVSLVDARGRRVYGPERLHSIGQLTGPFEQFTPEVFQAEMETLAARAGQQVANTFIYR